MIRPPYHSAEVSDEEYSKETIEKMQKGFAVVVIGAMALASLIISGLFYFAYIILTKILN